MIKSIITLMLFFSIAPAVFADGDLPTYPQTGKTIPIKKEDGSIRPRVPSRQSVECYYDGESLYLSFAYSEGECILTVTDNATLAEDDYTFDSSVPATINIGYVSDTSLTITTSLGQTYSGEIK